MSLILTSQRGGKMGDPYVYCWKELNGIMNGDGICTDKQGNPILREDGRPVIQLQPGIIYPGTITPFKGSGYRHKKKKKRRK